MDPAAVPYTTSNQNQTGLLYPDGSEALVLPAGKGLGSSTPSHWKNSVASSSPLSPPPSHLPHLASLLRSQALPPPTVVPLLPVFSSSSTALHATPVHNISTPSNSDTTPPSYANHGSTHYFPSTVNPPTTTQAPSFVVNENQAQTLFSHNIPTKASVKNPSALGASRSQSKPQNFVASSTNSHATQPSYDRKHGHATGSVLPNLATHHNPQASQGHTLPSYHPTVQLPLCQNISITSPIAPAPSATIPPTTNSNNNAQLPYCGHQTKQIPSANPIANQRSCEQKESHAVGSVLPNLATHHNPRTSQDHTLSSHQPHFQFPPCQNLPATSPTAPSGTILPTANSNINAQPPYCGHTMRLTHHRIPLYDISKLLSSGCTIIEGRVYNDKGHNICGVLNQHDKPCKRIGKCPFHTMPTAVTQSNSCNGYVDARGNVATTEQSGNPQKMVENVRPLWTPKLEENLPQHWHAGTSSPQDAIMRQKHEPGYEYRSTSSPEESSSTTTTLRACGVTSIQRDFQGGAIASAVNGPRPPRKVQYKHGWSKDEHFMFLRGLQKYKRGCWKQISLFVKTRTPTQVQSHAQKYFLRQRQFIKNKRSIHDLSIDSPEMQEVARRLRFDSTLSPKEELGVHRPFDPPLREDFGVRRTLEPERMALQGDVDGSSNLDLHSDLGGAFQRGMHPVGSNLEFSRNFVMSDRPIEGLPHRDSGELDTRMPANEKLFDQKYAQLGNTNVHGPYAERRLSTSVWDYDGADGSRTNLETRHHSTARSQGLYRGVTEGFEALVTVGTNGGYGRIGGIGIGSNADVGTGQRDNITAGSRRITTGLGSLSSGEMRASQGVAPAGLMSGVGARHM